jgi:hypothetical protein
MSFKAIFALPFALALLGGCTGPFETRSSLNTQDAVSVLQERSPRTRVLFVDQNGVAAKAVVATLQDLGFQVDFSARELNLVTGWRMGGQSVEKVTVTFQRIDKDFVRFRASFSNDGDDVGVKPLLYQNFFTSLSKSVFLAKNGLL